MKSISFIFNKAPYGKQASRELLDICLMSSAFEMPISVIFKDQGVLQLLKNQEPELLAMKNHSKTFQALELYGVENVMICKESLEKLNIDGANLLDIGTCANRETINQAIEQSHFVLML